MLGLFMVSVPISIVVYSVLPAKLEQGTWQYRLTLVGAIFSTAITALFEFGIFAAVNIALGNEAELRDFLEMFSVPLAFISTNFLIKPHSTGFLDLCGIIFGNSLFYGTALYLCGSIVRQTLKRSAPITMAIDPSSQHPDDV